MRKMICQVVFLLGFATSIYSQAVVPVLSNFRVEDSHKDRVYFDVVGDISGLTTQGFVISGKKIKQISTSGNYFEVDKAFTFWDNNSIRLGENDDTSDVNSKMHNFTLTYIENRIDEPTATTNRYVSVGGSGDGTSEDNSASLAHAFSNAKAGETWWIKAGDYGSQNIIASIDGAANSPIKFIGYKTIIGDITSNYIQDLNDIDNNWSTSEMPTLTGSGSGAGIEINGLQFVVFRNIQMEEYSYGIEAQTTINDHLVFDRINGREFGSYFILFESYVPSTNLRMHSNNDMKFIDCVGLNSDWGNWYVTGDGNNLFKGLKSYSNGKSGEIILDYHISFNGNHNIAVNCLAKNEGNLNDGYAHGIGVKGINRGNEDQSEYNLITNCEAQSVVEGFYLRNNNVNYNVIKDCVYTNDDQGDINSSWKTGGVWIWGGVNNTIVERVTVTNAHYALAFFDNQEENNYIGQEVGNNNTIRNCIFNKISWGLFFAAEGGAPLNNTDIINCTFNDITQFVKDNGGVSVSNFNVINSIIANAGTPWQNSGSNINFTYSNFYENKNNWVPVGTGNMNVDPKFENQSSRNFKLKSDSPLIDKGKSLDNIKSDFDQNARPQGSSNDIGAFEYQDNTTSSVKANAGEDQTICKGESVTLTASGGSSYAWSNGISANSITVNPTETTTYSVTVSEGSDSDTAEVVVTVNNVTANAGADVTINEGDSVTLTASGGDSYLWDNGETTASITISPSATTTYAVTVSKNGCEATDQIEVKVSASSSTVVVTANAGEDQTICKGESVTLTASGGSSYSWSNGETTKSITVNPTETTSYTATVSEGSSSDTDEVVVTVNNVTANAGADVTINEGESITLTASGGDSYLWDNGETTASITVSPLATTDYSVTVTKNGCDDTDSVKVTVNLTTVSVTADAGEDQSICQGESVTLTATGGSSYSWSNGATTQSITVNPTDTKVYTATVTEGSSSDTDQVVVTVNNVTANAGSDVTINEGESITLTASGGDSYLWDNGETTASIAVSPSATTTYTVTVSKNGCEAADQIEIKVSNSTSPIVVITEAESNLDQSIQIFPNPTDGILNVNIIDFNNDLDLDFINLNGSILYQGKALLNDGNYVKQIDISNFTKGVYYMRFYNDSEKYVKKIILI